MVLELKAAPTCSQRMSRQTSVHKNALPLHRNLDVPYADGLLEILGFGVPWIARACVGALIQKFLGSSRPGCSAVLGMRRTCKSMASPRGADWVAYCVECWDLQQGLLLQLSITVWPASA